MIKTGFKLYFKAIIIGAAFCLCLLTFLDVLIVGIFGGLATGLWIANKYLEGTINGAISAAIATGIYLAVLVTFIYPTMFITQPVEIILLWLVCVISGGLGGIVGIFIRKQTRKIQQSEIKSKEESPDSFVNQNVSQVKGSLICNKCGGYYELKKGETPDDFAQCQCGGELRFKPYKSIKPPKLNQFNKKRSIWIRIIAIEVGAVIIFISGLFIHSIFALDLLLMVTVAGFVTAFTAGGNYQDGAFNSGGAGLIGALLVFLSYGYLNYIKISLLYTEIVGMSLIILYLLLALVGSLIAIFLHPFIETKYYEFRAGRSWKDILNSDRDKKAHILLIVLAILIGAFISFLFNIFFVILAGFITSFIAKGSYKDGIIYSALAGFLGGIATIILATYFGSIDSAAMAIVTVVEFILTVIIVIIGGILAIFVRKRLDYRKNEILICDQCKSEYEVDPENFSNKDEFTCDCGGILRHSRRPSLVLVTLGYIMAFLGGISLMGLIIGVYLYTRENPVSKFHGKRMMIIALIATVLWGILYGILVFLTFNYWHSY